VYEEEEPWSEVRWTRKLGIPKLRLQAAGGDHKTPNTLPRTTPKEIRRNKVVTMAQPQSLFAQGTLPEENVRALDQLRQRLQQMSLSLTMLKTDLTRTESLPTW
jgi:hypothetical protein